MTDMSASLNSLGEGGGGASAGAGETSFLDKLSKNPELLSIIFDMIGSKMAPDSPFAGVGMALGKSSLASKAEEANVAQKGKFQDMIGNIVKSLTGEGQPGPTRLQIESDPSGGYQYKIGGMEAAEKRLDKISQPAIRSSEDFLKDFGGRGR